MLNCRTGAGGQVDEIVAAHEARERHFDHEPFPRRILGQRQLDRERLAAAIEQAHFAAIEGRQDRPLGADALVASELEARDRPWRDARAGAIRYRLADERA